VQTEIGGERMDNGYERRNADGGVRKGFVTGKGDERGLKSRGKGEECTLANYDFWFETPP
jgi:hypothetical protein